MTRRVILAPLQWWARHPWVVGWSLLVLHSVLLFKFLIEIHTPRKGDVVPVFLLGRAPDLLDCKLKANSDLQALTSAINMYSAYRGSPPARLTDLTSGVTNWQGQTNGPFLTEIPSAPRGWTKYHYQVRADGTFTIATTGDGTAVKYP